MLIILDKTLEIKLIPCAVFFFQILSVTDLCSAYLFLAKYNLKKRNLEAAEMYAHKCCEFNEVSELFYFVVYFNRSSEPSSQFLFLGMSLLFS